MTIFALARAEFARLTSSRIAIVSLVALMVVPIIYGGLYLWGNNDPYSNLDQVPAALVVSDTGTTVNGSAINYGRSTADTLLTGKKFGWHEVTARAASAGVRSGKYDFALSFPANFSSSLVSASGSTPVSARLTLTTDDTNSYLSTTLAKQAAESVRVAVAKKVSQTASGTLLSGIASLRGGLADAGSGASKLADAAATATTGASSLSSGSASVAAGASTLSSGLAALAHSTSGLPASASTLSRGAGAVASGLGAAATASSTLAAAAAQAASLSLGLSSQFTAIVNASNLSPERQSILKSQLGQLTSLTGAASTGLGQLAPSLAELSTGATQVSTGASGITAAAAPLADAVGQAAAGARTLAAGSAQTAAGASTLSSGLTTLSAGTARLADALHSATDSVPSTTATSRAATAQRLADPITVMQNPLTVAQNYGAGLAPFFLSLSAWIGMYALFLLLRPLSRRALTAVQRPLRTTMAGWVVPSILGIIQMVALFVVVTGALHLRVANPFGLLALLAFVSITFAAIVLALNVVLGSVGQFLALVFMVIQLVTAGGTFPWQTLPGPLAALHQVLPMSHAVDSIRQLMYGGTGGGALTAALPLLLWLLGSLLVATFSARSQHKYRTLRQVRPSPIGA